MSKASRAGNAVGKIVTYILVVLLVLGVAGIIAYFALRSQGVTYYVEFGNERYFGNTEGGSLSLPTDATYAFSVKSLTGNEVNFDVKVRPESWGADARDLCDVIHIVSSGDTRSSRYRVYPRFSYRTFSRYAVLAMRSSRP